MANKETRLSVKSTANMSNIQKAIKDLKSNLKELGSSNNIEDVKKKFDMIQESSASAGVKIKQIKKLMNEMANNGWSGDDMFKQLAKSAVDLEKQANIVKDTLKEIRNEATDQSMTERFEKITQSTDDAGTKLKELKKLLTDMMMSGETDAPLFQKILEEADKAQDEISRVAAAEKEVNDLLSKTPELTLAEQFDNIKNSASPVESKLQEITNLMAECIKIGATDTPFFKELTEQASALQNEIKTDNDALEEARRILSEINSTAGSMSVEDKFNNIKNSVEDLNAKKKELKDLAVEYIQVQNGNKTDEIYKKITKEIAEVNKKLEETKRLEQEIEQGGKKIDFSKLATQLAGVGSTVAGISGLMGGLGDNAANAILKVQSAMASLQGVQAMVSSGAGSLGPALANPYVAGAVAIGAMGTALYQYNVQLDESLKKTGQFTGLAGNELMSLRNGIKATADTFGKDYDTVLNSVDHMMQQFGISGEHALNIIKDGFVAGADENGRMLDMMSKYGPAFSDLGVSAEEFTAIIANTRNGIFSEEGMTLIQQAGKRIREFSKQTADSLDAIGINSQEMFDKLQSGELKTIDAIKEISGKMKETGVQTQEAGNIMKNVFGKSGAAGGAELISALEEIDTDLEHIKNQTGEWGKSMDELNEANRELENAMASMFQIGNGGWAEMTNKIKTKVIKAMAELINYFIDLYNECVTVRSSVATIATAFKLVWDVCKAVVKAIASLMKNVSKMISALVTFNPEKLKEGITGVFTDLADSAVAMGKEMAEDFVDGFNQAVNGRIEKVKVNTEAEDQGKRTKMSKGTGVNSNESKTGSTKTQKIDYKAVVDDGSLEIAKKKLKAFSDQKLLIDISDTKAIEECEKEIQKWKIEVEKREIILGIKTGRDDLREIYDKIKTLTEQRNNLDIEFDATKIDYINKQISELIDQRYVIEVALGIDGLMSDFRDIEAHLANLSYQREQIDIELNPEEYERITQEINSLTDKKYQLQIEIDRQLAPATLKEISDEISRLQKERVSLNPELNKDRIEEITSRLNELTEKEYELKVRIGEIPEGPLSKVQHDIQKLNDELIRLNPEVNQQKINEINSQIENKLKEEKEIKVKLGIINEPTIGAKEEKLTPGSVADKRQSRDNALGRVEQMKQDFSIGLIGEDEVISEINEINQKLMELGLKPIEIKIDGNKIMTAADQLEAFKTKMDGISGIVSSVGGAFNSLGSAIGGSAGEMMNFAGQAIQAMAQIIPQIVTMITAKQVEAQASASASAAALPFPANIAAIASVIATIASLFASMPKFAQGGIVGGSSFSGDKVIARVNSGEGILTAKGVDNLHNMVNGQNSNSVMSGQVDFKIDGKVLKGVLSNINKIENKFK